MDKNRFDSFLAVVRDWGQDENFETHFESVDHFISVVGRSSAVEAAELWLKLRDPAARAVAIDVLGVVVEKSSRFKRNLLDAVRNGCTDPDVNVRWSTAHALGLANVGRMGLLALRTVSTDLDPDVRWQAIRALPLAIEDPRGTDAEALRLMIAACDDPDADIRDWAIFGLGVLLDVDGPDVREMLNKHLTDDNPAACGEAAVGLARRRDRNIIPLVIAKLAMRDPLGFYVEAAGEFAVVDFLPALLLLKETGWKDQGRLRPAFMTLDAAIERCGKGS